MGFFCQIAIMAIFIASCNRSPLLSYDSNGNLLKEGRIVHQENLMQNFEGQEVFYVLSRGNLEPIGKEPPGGFYIKGVVRQGKFIPQSDILGVGNMATAGTYGWLELNGNQFYNMESGKGANMPFVKGYKIKDGSFIPSEREIFQEP